MGALNISRQTLVIAIGHRCRRDDGVGPAVGDELVKRGIPVVEHCGEGLGLIDAWQGAETAIIIDAAVSGAAPGTVIRISFDNEKKAPSPVLPAGFFRSSSHLFGLAEAVETARALGRLPERLLIYGIEGEDFRFGNELTAAVAAAVSQTVTEICAELFKNNQPDSQPGR